jgi:LmbE family N-acetylglucosaminyl deacetylase
LTTTGRRLLCLTAHPDDESGAFGGALMLARQQGFATYLLCLTAGTAAHFREGATSDEDLGRMRREELAAACEVLQVTEHRLLDYPDGQLAQESFYGLTGAIVSYIRRWRPQIVLTFGGDGSVNLHRDHTMVSVAATAAFHWAGRPEFFPAQIGAMMDGLRLGTYSPQKLYYASTPFVSVRDKPELNGASTVPWSLSVELGEMGDRKLEAFMKHSSQQGVLARVSDAVREHFRRERYLLAAAPGLIGVRDDPGLFEGFIED